MEVKVKIEGIENLKTRTEKIIDKDKEGEVIGSRLVTKVQFEAEIDPEALANVHRLLAAEAPVHIIIGSPQAIMEMESTKKAVMIAR